MPSRIAKLLMVIGLCLPVIFCSQPPQPKLYVEGLSEPLAGEIVSVKAVAADKSTAADAAYAGMKEAERWDKMLDHRREENQRWMNAPTPLAPISYDPALTEILELSLGLAIRTEGLFNPLIAPLSEHYQRGEWLDDAQLCQLLPLLDRKKLVWDKDAHTLLFGLEGMGLDLDAIAQGYIADRCLAAMLAAGANSGAGRCGRRGGSQRNTI